ncbi:MAG: UPF0280 family protein [Spirochaetales bacterium]|nr:UPF0280 family protein [Spirochaetales bacterium]
MRSFRRFTYKDADYRISSPSFINICNSIIRERDLLENFIEKHSIFLTSLTPLSELPDYAPAIAKRMHKAGIKAGVGPMAAVAGTIAQLVVEKTLNMGDRRVPASLITESIVENGGDIFMVLKKELTLGIFSDVETLQGKLAFRIDPEETPLAVCSSSSTMGHSLSLGNCNLATVFSRSGAMADAAATKACNLVKNASDIQRVLDAISSIPGITGLMIIKGNRVGIAGDLPEIVSNTDPEMMNKITRSPKTTFFSRIS